MIINKYFKAYIKNNQTRHLSKTWHHTIIKREIIKNNFLINWDIQQAKEFANTLMQWEPNVVQIKHPEPTIIFSKDMVYGFI